MAIGRHHPLLKRIRLLRRLAQARRDQGLLIAEGPHVAREAVEAGCEIEAAVYDPRLIAAGEGVGLLAALNERGVACHEVAETVMDGLQDARSPQPLLLLVRTAPLAGRPWRTSRNPLVVVCDGVQDPGNLGSIVRSADAAGAAALFATRSCADPHHPRTVRAGMGSTFRLPVERADLPAIVERLRNEGLTLVGTCVRGGDDYCGIPLTGPCALFFGGEGSGLDRAFLDSLDLAISIPLEKGVESLSVGAAVAVTLFEARRQRRLNPSVIPGE